MTRLDELRDLYHLAEAARGMSRGINTSRLEDDFLAFSLYSPKKTLTVERPRLYALQGEEHEEHKHIASAVAALRMNGITLPQAVDFSGAFEGIPSMDALIFLSLEQFNADHYRGYRSYLNPLLEQVYSEGAQLIKSFALHEALIGTVSVKRGDLDLKEIALFPERFAPGPYQLSVTLDTPAKTIKKFSALHALLDNCAASPQEFLLHQESVQEVAGKAVELRNILGSLSRYERPKTQTFQAPANSCVLRTNESTFFYLYEPMARKNVAVCFDAASDQSACPGLAVLRGEEYQSTLQHLTRLGFYAPSEAVLQQRLSDMKALFEDATRGRGTPLTEGHEDYQKLMQELEGIQRQFQSVLNPTARTQFVLRQAPELLEFLVCPATDDPIIHELLPRLSWNAAIREYQDTDKFIASFQQADAEKRRQMLNSASSNVVFENQQNNDVNVWLYNNYREFCVQEGVQFEVRK